MGEDVGLQRRARFLRSVWRTKLGFSGAARSVNDAAYAGYFCDLRGGRRPPRLPLCVHVTIGLFQRIPYSTEQGIISAEQGIGSGEQGKARPCNNFLSSFAV